MSLHWTDKNRAQMNVAKALRQLGFDLIDYDYSPGDISTDLSGSETWSGVAVHPDYPGLVAGVDVGSYDVKWHSGKSEDGRTYPVFQSTPGGSLWHVEKDSRILTKGTGFQACAAYGDPGQRAAVKVAGEILSAIRLYARPGADVPAPAPAALPGGVELRENPERNGIEIRFPSKPDEDVRQALKDHGFRWSRRQELWYARHTSSLWTWAQSFAGSPGALEQAA